MAIRPKPYQDELTARQWLEGVRWRRIRRCPECRSTRTALVPNERPTPYRCIACRKYFSVRTGSAMDGTSLPLRHWVLAMHLLRSGITLADFTRTLGIGPKAAETARKEDPCGMAAPAQTRRGGLRGREGEPGALWPVRRDARPATQGRPPKVLERINATPRMIARALFRSR